MFHAWGKMKNRMMRREFLGTGCTAAAFCIGAGTEAGWMQSGNASALPFPWKYSTLNVNAVKQRAYNGYFKAGCMYGVFEAIAGSAAEALGKPYTDFPFMLSSYGGGGVASYGSLCGTCNGAAMAISLFHQGDLRTKLIQDVFSWYETSKLPSYIPETPVRVRKDFVMASSRPDSVLCHVSITRWTKASELASFSPERTERCARLVADVAGYAAGILNQAQTQYAPKVLLSEVASGCLECHAQGKQAPNEPEVVSRMSCTTCHPDAHNQKKQ
jgi:hypothetical protein